MRKFNMYTMTGATAADTRIINLLLDDGMDLMVDEYNRVFTESGVYVADCVETEEGNGIGC